MPPELPTGAIRSKQTITCKQGQSITVDVVVYPKCVKCGSTNNNERHWCLKCFNEWNTFKKADKCLIDDDE